MSTELEIVVASIWYAAVVVLFILLGKPAIAKKTYEWRQRQPSVIRRMLLPGSLGQLDVWRSQQRQIAWIAVVVMTGVYALVIAKVLVR